jgi:DNA primase
MALTPQWMDELRARTTLSALVGRSIKITKAGREYKGCCPFHNEKTPSFYVNDEKGFYHCFGCSAHGDAIRWMTDQRGLSFMDAVKELAEEAGMQVPAMDPKAAKQAEQRAGLHDVMQAAQDWFVQQLGSIEGAGARSYLEKRGLTEQTIRDFGFGFAPDSKGRLREALKAFGDDLLVEGGLLIKVDDKEPYDRFRGRLMIPIRDPRGRIIAFGGRILGEGEPKYLNSPDTPLFDKGRTLYNLDKCSPASRSTGRVIVVEGYMDVIAIAQAGFSDAVAPLGTALTEQQIQMLWRMTEKPLLCFDGDNAGQKAAMRAADRALPLLKPGHSLQFVTLPDGQDPDDLVKSAGPKAFKQLLDNSEALVDRLWNAEMSAQPLNTPEDRAGLKQRLGLHMANIADGEIKRHYADAFRERFDSLFAAKPRAFTPRTGKANGKWQAPAFKPAGVEAKGIGNKGADLLMPGVLVNLLLHPQIIEAHREALMTLEPRNANQAALLAEILDQTLLKKSLDSAGLLTILGEHLYNVASELLQGDGKAFAYTRKNKSGETEDIDIHSNGPDLSKFVGEMIKLMKQRPALEQALERATIRVSQELTEDNYAEQQRLRSEKEAFDRRIFELTERGLDI